MSFVVISACFSYVIDKVLGEPDTRDVTTDLRLFFFSFVFLKTWESFYYIYEKKTTSVVHCRPFSILVLNVCTGRQAALSDRTQLKRMFVFLFFFTDRISNDVLMFTF